MRAGLLTTVMLAVLMTVGGSGCSDDLGGALTQECHPNETRQCECAEGLGISTCSSMGSEWGPCDCQSQSNVVTSDATDGDTTCVASDKNHARGCYEGAVFWFDDCGSKGELIESCKLPEEACEEGQCVVGCVPMTEKICEGNAVWWVDSCNNKGQLVEACAENTICSNAECVPSCTPHTDTFCLDNAIYWYDSCGNAETPSEICQEDEFCKGCTAEDEDCNQAPSCVKAFYDGDWKLSADPNTKDACGLGNAEYFDQVLSLSIDGQTATGNIQVAGFSVDFAGTLDGKHLTLEGSYTQNDGTAHDELIDVTFTSLTTLEGTHTDSFSLLTFPCTLYWQIEGTKQ